MASGPSSRPGERTPRPGKARDRATSARGILDICRRSDVRLIRFAYCGLDGIIRGAACHVPFLASYLESGIGRSASVQSLNVLDELVPESEFGPLGEIRLMPDLSTFSVLPYSPKSAGFICDITLPDGSPSDVCGRAFLKRALQRADRHGLKVFASFENEFVLARRHGEVFEPIDESLCFSTAGMNVAAPMILDIIDALAAQGVVAELYYVEHGPGQQELPVRFSDGLRAADNQIRVRETVRGVASNHGLVASFAPRPYLDHAGNGCHIHLSCWDERAMLNRFHDGQDSIGLSKLAYAFLGGVMAHLPGLVALSAPSVNSYRRLQPRAWASAYAVWGPDNREAAVRVPSKKRGREMEATTLEFKPADASANPHLALGALIIAGLDGIERKIDPGLPTLADPDTLPDAERSRRGIRRLPTSLGEALEALERDDLLRTAMGEPLFREYLAVKRSEVRGFEGKDAAFEIRHHFSVY